MPKETCIKTLKICKTKNTLCSRISNHQNQFENSQLKLCSKHKITQILYTHKPIQN